MRKKLWLWSAPYPTFLFEYSLRQQQSQPAEIRRGHKVHKYIEYHNVCPLVGIRTPPPPLPQVSVPPPPRNEGVGESQF